MFEDSKQIELHFSECWDESLWIDEAEAVEWLEELQSILDDDSHSVRYRLQRVIDEITNTV